MSAQTMPKTGTESRARAVTSFLARQGLGNATRAPLAGDASARRYERLTLPDGKTLILVDTPNPADDLLPFISIGDSLRSIGLSTPIIHAADGPAGLAIQEDFGNETLTALLDQGEDATSLYGLATDALIHLHRHLPVGESSRLTLPPYDAANFLDQVTLFVDFYMPMALDRPISEPERSSFLAAWGEVLKPACSGPTSLLLRDYHVDNVLRLPRDGVAAAGLIDYQSGGEGPVAYDLVSLLEDARRDVPPDLATAMTERYLAAFPDIDTDAYRRSCAVLGAVRHLRIVAVFARLASQMARRGYLVHMPRVWRLLDARLADPALAPVSRWLDRHLPADRRVDLVIAGQTVASP